MFTDLSFVLIFGMIIYGGRIHSLVQAVFVTTVHLNTCWRYLPSTGVYIQEQS